MMRLRQRLQWLLRFPLLTSIEMARAERSWAVGRDDLASCNLRSTATVTCFAVVVARHRKLLERLNRAGRRRCSAKRPNGEWLTPHLAAAVALASDTTRRY